MAKMGYPRLYKVVKVVKVDNGKGISFVITCNGKPWNVKEDSDDNPKEYLCSSHAISDLDHYVPLTKG